MKSIMYHYVRDADKNYPYWNYLSKKKFKEHINKFYSKNESLVPYDKIYYKKNLNILTFDDGIKDHLWVAEKLKKKNIAGIFFISSLPLKKKQILDVHKAHLILGKIKSSIAYNKLLEILKKKKYINFINKNENEKFQMAYFNQKDNCTKKKFKKIINYYGNINLKTKLLNELCNYFEIKQTADQFYLNKKEIKYLNDLGMLIGCHTDSHFVLSRISYYKQLEEIKKNKSFLEKIINKKISIFCYPYGGKKSYNENTLKILKKLNFKYGFSVEPKDISKFTFYNKPFELPRYDCNIF